jgi:hypothetical protein
MPNGWLITWESMTTRERGKSGDALCRKLACCRSINVCLCNRCHGPSVLGSAVFAMPVLLKVDHKPSSAPDKMHPKPSTTSARGETLENAAFSSLGRAQAKIHQGRLKAERGSVPPLLRPFAWNDSQVNKQREWRLRASSAVR